MNLRTDIFGWFDDIDTLVPAHDPGLQGKCPLCGKKLMLPVKTISIAEPMADKSYFYRAHSDCYESSSEEDICLIESLLIDGGHE